MNRAVTVALITLGLVSAMSGQGQKLAMATSGQPFTLRGETVNPSGVPSWPVMAGDESVAGSAPVTLTFNDGSRVALAPGTRAIVEVLGGKVVMRLISGEAAYDLKSQDAIQLAVQDKSVQVTDLRGSLAAGATTTKRAAAGFWTARNVALVLGAAAATAAGVGIAATRPPASVSPSQ
jgi:hypothetical protein